VVGSRFDGDLVLDLPWPFSIWQRASFVQELTSNRHSLPDQLTLTPSLRVPSFEFVSLGSYILAFKAIAAAGGLTALKREIRTIR